MTRASGLAVEIYGMGVRRRPTTTTTATPTSTSPRVGPTNTSSAISAAANSQDVTAKAGVGDPGFSHERGLVRLRQRRQARPLRRATTSSGRPRRTSTARSTARTNPTARRRTYKGQSPTLYHNRGNGTFENVTERAGLHDPTSKALGVACSTTTTTAGPTSSSPTTPSPTGSTRTTATALSPTRL